MNRATFVVATLLLVACSHASSAARPFVFGVQFPFAENVRTSVPCSAKAADTRVEIAEIIANPQRYAGRRVNVTGCYVVDPYHGAFISDAQKPDAALPMFGDCGDAGTSTLNWAERRVCGTFFVTVVFRTQDEPMKFLCPELCLVRE